MSDHAHAINMLRVLIANDFKYRHGVRDIDVWQYALTVRTPPVLSEHWWDHESRRLDIARLRSYIGAVRVMEHSEDEAHDVTTTGCEDCPFLERDDFFGERRGCNVAFGSMPRTGPTPDWCPLRKGPMTIGLVTK